MTDDGLYELDPDTYWSQDARDDRAEWDDHLRAVEEDERDRLTRDLGEAA